jgi:hypothetical protein
MAKIRFDEINPDKVQEIMFGLDPAEIIALGKYGNASQWSARIKQVFSDTASLPPGFFSMDPSAQIGYAINQIVGASNLSPNDPHNTAGAANRFAQVLSTRATRPVTNSEKIESLIADTDAANAQRRGGHFLVRRPI